MKLKIEKKNFFSTFSLKNSSKWTFFPLPHKKAKSALPPPSHSQNSSKRIIPFSIGSFFVHLLNSTTLIRFPSFFSLQMAQNVASSPSICARPVLLLLFFVFSCAHFQFPISSVSIRRRPARVNYHHFYPERMDSFLWALRAPGSQKTLVFIIF